MPLFICDGCGCVENTASSDFWIQRREGLPDRRCSKCRTGKWHGRFPQRPYAGQKVISPSVPPEHPSTDATG